MTPRGTLPFVIAACVLSAGHACLYGYAAGRTYGNVLVLSSCGASPSEAWIRSGTGVYSQSASTICLDLCGSSLSIGSQVGTWTCNGGSNQLWLSANQNRGLSVGTSSSWCLSATSPLAAGSAATVAPCNASDPLQNILFDSAGRFVQATSGLCFDSQLSPSATQTSTPSTSRTRTGSGTATLTPSQLRSASLTPSASPTGSQLQTRSQVQSVGSTLSQAATSTQSQSPTPSRTSSQGTSPSGIATQTLTSSASPLSTPSITQSRSRSQATTASATVSVSATPSQRSSGTATATATTTASSSQGVSASESSSRSVSQLSTRSTTVTPTQSTSATQAPSASQARTTSPTGTLSRSSSQSWSPSQSVTGTETATRTVSRTPSSSRTPTTTATRSMSGSATGTASISSTRTTTESLTPSPSQAHSPSRSQTNTPSLSASLSATPSESSSLSGSATGSASATTSASQSLSFGASASVTASQGASKSQPRVSVSGTSTVSVSGTPSASATASLSATASTSASPSPSGTSSATATPTSSATRTQSLSASSSGTSSASASPSLSGSRSSTASPSLSGSPSSSPTASSSDTPSASATASSSPTPSQSATLSMSGTHSATATPSSSGSPSQPASATATSSQSQSPSESLTPTTLSSASPSATQTLSQSASGSSAWTQTQTSSGSGSSSESQTTTLTTSQVSLSPSPSQAVTQSSTGSSSQRSSLSSTATMSRTETSSRSETTSQSRSPSVSRSPSATQSRRSSSLSQTPTRSVSPSQRSSPSSSRSLSRSQAPSGTQAESPSASASGSSSSSPSLSASASQSQSSSASASQSLSPRSPSQAPTASTSFLGQSQTRTRPALSSTGTPTRRSPSRSASAPRASLTQSRTGSHSLSGSSSFAPKAPPSALPAFTDSASSTVVPPVVDGGAAACSNATVCASGASGGAGGTQRLDDAGGLVIGLAVAAAVSVCCLCCAAAVCLCVRRRRQKKNGREAKSAISEADCSDDPREAEMALPCPAGPASARYTCVAVTPPAETLMEARRSCADTSRRDDGAALDAAIAGVLSAATPRAADGFTELPVNPPTPLKPLLCPGAADTSVVEPAVQTEEANASQGAQPEEGIAAEGGRIDRAIRGDEGTVVVVIEPERSAIATPPGMDSVNAALSRGCSEVLSHNCIDVPADIDVGRGHDRGSPQIGPPIVALMDEAVGTRSVAPPTSVFLTSNGTVAEESDRVLAYGTFQPPAVPPVALRRPATHADSESSLPAGFPPASSRALPPSRGAATLSRSARPLSRPGGVTIVRSVRSRAAQRVPAAGGRLSGAAGGGAGSLRDGGDSAETPVAEEEELLGSGRVVDGRPERRGSMSSVVDEAVEVEEGHLDNGRVGEHISVPCADDSGADGFAPFAPPLGTADALLCGVFEDLFLQETPRRGGSAGTSGGLTARVGRRGLTPSTFAPAAPADSGTALSPTGVPATFSYVVGESFSVARRAPGPPGEIRTVAQMAPHRSAAHESRGPGGAREDRRASELLYSKEEGEVVPPPGHRAGADDCGAGERELLRRGIIGVAMSPRRLPASGHVSEGSSPRGEFRGYLEGLLQESPRGGFAGAAAAAISCSDAPVSARRGGAPSVNTSPPATNSSPASIASPSRALCRASPAGHPSSARAAIPVGEPGHERIEERAADSRAAFAQRGEVSVTSQTRHSARGRATGSEGAEAIASEAAMRLPGRVSDAGRSLARSHTVGPNGPSWDGAGDDAAPPPRRISLIRRWMAGAAAEAEGNALQLSLRPSPVSASIQRGTEVPPPAWASVARGPLARRHPPGGSGALSWAEQLRDERGGGREADVGAAAAWADPAEDWWAAQKPRQPQPVREIEPPFSPPPRFMRPTQSRLHLLHQPDLLPPQGGLHRSVSGPSLTRPQPASGDRQLMPQTTFRAGGSVRRRVQPHDWSGSLRADGYSD